ncbi:MAG: hypothetical protein IKZ22_02280 [Kiritimatiellae bacterium]|nr:hypothetical protein [Kiritimatiellia bacterium]
MKILIATLVLALAPVFAIRAAEDAGFSGIEECEMNRRYVGAGAMIVLPEGDSDIRRLGGASVRCGYYFAEFWAAEAEVAALENHAGLSLDVLWHWWGYERFDPFFTFGAKGWIGRGGDQFGPELGTGFFYHLTDSWSLRCDADITLGLENETETVYTISAGFQYSF